MGYVHGQVTSFNQDMELGYSMYYMECLMGNAFNQDIGAGMFQCY